MFWLKLRTFKSSLRLRNLTENFENGTTFEEIRFQEKNTSTFVYV